MYVGVVAEAPEYGAAALCVPAWGAWDTACIAACVANLGAGNGVAASCWKAAGDGGVPVC